jgi:hypothetical protein
MGEAQSGYDATEFKNDLDDICAGVMPDSWAGHGRLKIAERGFSEEKRTFARRLLAKLDDKYPDLDAETLAEKAIAETEKRY